MNLRKHLNPSDTNYKSRRITNLLNMSMKDHIINDNKLDLLNSNNNKKELELELDKGRDNSISKKVNANKNSIEDNIGLNKPSLEANNITENKMLKSFHNYSTVNNPLMNNPTLTNNYVNPFDDRMNKRTKKISTLNPQDALNIDKNNLEYKTNEDNTIKKNYNEKNLCHNDSFSNINETSIFNFQYINFKGLSYCKYIFLRLSCSNRLKVYQLAIKEIENLLDFYVYCNHLKHQYLLKDPRELKE